MPFQMVPSTDLSLARLVELHRQGAYVLKTPHVGNIYPNNLAMAALGLPIMLVDQTIGSRDRNFHPHKVICGGIAETVAHPDRMTSHSRITHASTRMRERFVPGTLVAKAHVDAFRDAFPQAAIETTSDRARRMSHLMLPLLEVLTSVHPESWDRLVFRDGSVSNGHKAKSWAQVKLHGIHGLSEDGSGWVVPNTWNILCDGIIGALQTEQDVVYALSGPDMIRYYPPFVASMSFAYDAVRGRLHPSLPKRLTMVIVPVADMRFVTTKRRAAHLERVITAYQDLLATKRDIARRMSEIKDKAARAALITAVQQERDAKTRELRAATTDCPEIFYEIEEANYLSQYDLLSGEELFVHPWGVQASMSEVTDLFQALQRARPSAS